MFVSFTKKKKNEGSGRCDVTSRRPSLSERWATQAARGRFVSRGSGGTRGRPAVSSLTRRRLRRTDARFTA